jgi:phage terminase small subunit
LNLSKTPKKLSIQQERFKNNLLEGMNQKTAYIKAGYKARGAGAENNASRLLRNDRFATEFKKAKEKAAVSAVLTKGYVLSGLIDVAKRCQDEDNFQPSGANKALELLGKHLGIFEKDNVQGAPVIILKPGEVAKPDDTGLSADS